MLSFFYSSPRIQPAHVICTKDRSDHFLPQSFLLHLEYGVVFSVSFWDWHRLIPACLTLVLLPTNYSFTHPFWCLPSLCFLNTPSLFLPTSEPLPLLFPLPEKPFPMIFTWFTSLLHILRKPPSEKFHLCPLSFSITLLSFIFLQNISLPGILSYVFMIRFCLSSSPACKFHEVGGIVCLIYYPQSLDNSWCIHSRGLVNIFWMSECTKY